MRAVLGGAVLVLLLFGPGCGDGDGPGSTRLAGGEFDPQAARRYEAVATAVSDELGPFCGPSPGYVEPAPATGSDALGAPHRQFLDARVYELEPCSLDPGKRSQLRVARFPDGETRDAAIEANMARSARPATSWRYYEDFSVELWLLDTSANADTTKALAKAHDAVRVLPGMRVVLQQP